MKKILFIAVFTLTAHPAIASKTFCSMTLNSEDEIQVFKNQLPSKDFKFVELVPKNKDPHWFQKACESQVKCDVLLISGHFGGLYFGEKSTPILKLQDIEEASCRQSCPGILESPKEVFLMGCNTLAGKEADKRTPMQYLRVLVQDGFPRDAAERIVTSRYFNEGFSMADRAAISFPKALKVYGFDGTGPLGRHAAPRLKQYLKSVGNYSSYLDQLDSKANRRLGNAFQGFSIRAITPSREISNSDRRLSCDLRFASETRREESLKTVIEQKQFVRFLDHLRDYSPPQASAKVIQKIQRDQPQLTTDVNSLLDAKIATHHDLLSVKMGLLNIKKSFGLLSQENFDHEIRSSIQKALSKSINLVIADQVCDLAQKQPQIEFDVQWLKGRNIRASEYLPYILGCFRYWDLDVVSWVKSLDYSNFPTYLRREMLRSLKGRWKSEDKTRLLELASSFQDNNDRYELYRSAQEIYHDLLLNTDTQSNWGQNGVQLAFPFDESLDDQAKLCLKNASNYRGTGQRDGERWKCLEQFKLADNMWSCLRVANQMEEARSDGMDWQCLLKPKEFPSLGLCLDLSHRNPDPEKSDDMRWTCWDRYKQSGKFRRAECLRLASSMKIEGNRIKANWNCMNFSETSSPPEEYTINKVPSSQDREERMPAAEVKR